MNKKSLLAIVVAMAALAVHAQSAQKISQIVESQQINYGQAAYIALTYDWGGAADETSEQEALEAAVAKKWIKNGAADQAAIPLGEFCALCLNAVGLKGGVFCSLSKNSPRYSFKELKALGLLDKSADPAMKIDGQNALNLFSACVQEAEAAR